MTPESIREAVLRALSDIAPEADPATLRPDVDLRDQLDIDSMDFLNFVIAVHEELHVDIPESDYDRLRTLDDVVAYVLEQSPVSP
jgi:acyl carrier protein